MDSYLPSDSRAQITLDRFIQPLLTDLYASNNITEVVKAIVTNLPYGIAYDTELRMRFNLAITDIRERQVQVDNIARAMILLRVCDNLPAILDADENRIYYYMREDIIRWYNSDPINIDFFAVPDVEIITIEIHNDNETKTSNITLNEDQIIGIAYGLDALHDNHVTLRSSITNAVVAVSDIVQHALIYRLPITLATEELKRPFRVDILQADDIYLTIHFINPEFMQGVLSIAQWYHLPNNGKNFLWENLFQFTREALIELVF